MCPGAVPVFLRCLVSCRQLCPLLSLSETAGFHIIASSHPPKPSVPEGSPQSLVSLSKPQMLKDRSHRHGGRPCSGRFLFTFGLSGICLRLGRILSESLPLRFFMLSGLHLGYEPTPCPSCCLLGKLKDLSNDLDKGTQSVSSVCCPKKSTTCFRPNMTTDRSKSITLFSIMILSYFIIFLPLFYQVFHYHSSYNLHLIITLFKIVIVNHSYLYLNKMFINRLPLRKVCSYYLLFTNN